MVRAAYLPHVAAPKIRPSEWIVWVGEKEVGTIAQFGVNAPRDLLEAAARQMLMEQGVELL